MRTKAYRLRTWKRSLGKVSMIKQFIKRFDMLKDIKLALFISFIVYQPLYAGGSLQSQRFFTNTGGLFDHVGPLIIPENNAKVVQNITMDDRGLLSTRSGYTVIQSTSALLGFSTYTIVGGGYHTASSGSSFFAVIAGTDVYRIGNTYSSYSKITGSVSLTLSATNLAQKTDLNDHLIFCNDRDKPFYVDSTGNATTISTNTFNTAKTCATYGVYLVVANTNEGITNFTSRVRWSDINNINSFPALNYIDVEPDDGDAIVSIVAFDESVYIFKHRSIYRMLITGLDGPDAFIIRPVSRNIGAWSKNSVKVIPNVGIAFLAQNTEYLLSDSGLTPIGDPIQRTFDTINRSMWANSVAEVYPKRYQYWLSVSTNGSTNSEILVYDYIQRNWTVYAGIAASMLSQAEDSTGNNILISGDYHSVTYKQDNGTSDNPQGSSTTITAQYTTGDIQIGSPEITKNFKYIYIYSQGDLSYDLNVEAAYDFNTNYEYSTVVSLGSAGALYDTGLYDTDIYPGSGISVTRLELNRSARSIRLRFTNSSATTTFGLEGWTLVFQQEDFKQ